MDERKYLTLEEAIEHAQKVSAEMKAEMDASYQAEADAREHSFAPLKEELADLCHEQWSGWMRYMFSKAPLNEDGSWTMPTEFVQRWQRQMNTTYADLSESEQNSDRTEADKFMDVLRSWLP